MTILFWGRNGQPFGAEKVFGPVRPQKNWGRKGFFGAETFGAETVRGRNGLHPGSFTISGYCHWSVFFAETSLTC